MASSATVPRPPARLPELTTLSLPVTVTLSVTVAIELEFDCSNHGHSSGPESIIPGQNTGNPAGLTGRLRHRGLNVESRALARPLNSDSSRLHPSHHENHSPPPHLRRPVAICGRRVACHGVYASRQACQCVYASPSPSPTFPLSMSPLCVRAPWEMKRDSGAISGSAATTTRAGRGLVSVGDAVKRRLLLEFL